MDRRGFCNVSLGNKLISCHGNTSLEAIKDVKQKCSLFQFRGSVFFIFFGDYWPLII